MLAAADIYCQPNTEPEPFGVVLVEALAAGLPVVCSRHGGALEIIDDSCGRLVPPGAPGALSEVLTSLVQDPDGRSSLSVRAPARARALCDPPTQMRRLHDVMRRQVPAAVTR